MEKFMAEFGQGYVQTPFLSESNSVRYKISIAGSCPLSTAEGPYVKFQDNPVGSQTFSAGLHLRVFDPSTLNFRIILLEVKHLAQDFI
ncbi:hypothetical protein [Escherichia phage BYEP02]|nr:hypothetical protein [Escherichia phage BYEP02]